MNPLFRWLSGPGFLGTGAPRCSDLVVVALGLVLAGFGSGLHAARRGDHRRHGLLMGGTYLVLAAVVTVFVLWTLVAPQGPTPRLAASELRRSVYPVLMAVHEGAAVAGLALGLGAAILGLRALAYRTGRSPEPRWNRPHRALGLAAAALLTLASGLGLGVYALRYL